MPDLIILRLYPAEATTAKDFTNYLNGLTITTYDFSFNQIDGEQIGQAKYLPNDLPTAVIGVSLGRTEYRFSDLSFKIKRNDKEIINRSVHYNVNVKLPIAPNDLIPQPVVTEPDTPISDPYGSLNPISIYLPLPGPGCELDPTVSYVDLLEDGTPPNFAQLKAVVEKVLATDPGIAKDLTHLTPKQCKHIAYEIVWNRELESPPVLKRSLEAIYIAPGATTDDKEGKSLSCNNLASFELGMLSQ